MNWPITTISNMLPKGFHPCGKARCACCNHAMKSLCAGGLKPASNFLIIQNLTCETENVVYGISCSICFSGQIFYVGQTSRTLRHRMNQHRSNIACKSVTSVSSHFLETPHTQANLRVVAIEQVANKSKLELREEFWIKKLGTNIPPGGNQRLERNYSRAQPLVLAYHPASIRLVKRIRESFNLLENKPCSDIQPAYTRHKNLQGLIAPNRFKSQPRE